MNAAFLIQLALAALQATLDEAIKSNVADNIIAGLQSSIAELLKVEGSDVTWQQLNDLRVQKIW